MRKRILSMLLAFSLVLALVPVTVYADRVYCSVCGKLMDVTLSDYVYADGEYHQQYATCNGCGKIYSAGLSKHSGSGTATCDTGIKCDLCGGEFGALGHDWGEWEFNRGGKHYRFCKRNNNHVDSGVCSASGTVTCDSTATCVTCGSTFSILHLWSSWTSVGNGSHTRTCSRCAKTEKGECVGATRTCTAGSTCDSCGATQPALGHIWSDWKSGGQGAHIRTCSRDSRHYESEQCSGGTPTCVGAICSVCGQTYGRGNSKYHVYVGTVTKEATCTENGVMTYVCKYNSSHTKTETIDALDHDRVPHQAQAPTCTEIGWDEYDTCKRCNYTTYVEQPIDSSNHDLEHHAAKAPTCTEAGWDEYDTCKRCEYTTYVEQPIDSGNHDLVHHDAKTPTCTDIGWNEYDTCKRCNYTTYQELPALEHDYQQTVVKPACEKDGYTRYTCSRCKDTYTEDAVEKLYHWYGEWSPNGDETHSAGCRREGCKHTGTNDCQKFKFQVEENKSLIFCPVCGEVRNGECLELIAGSLATVITGGIPAGEVVARTRNEYLSVAFEYAGKLIVPTGRVKITLPAELLEGKTLMLIAPDGRETETYFEIDGEKAAFTLDFTDAEIPVMLLRTDSKA